MDTKDAKELKIDFRPGRELYARLEERAEPARSPDLVAKRDLERYYEALPLYLPKFCVEEALLLCQALNGLCNDVKSTGRLDMKAARRLWLDVKEELQVHPTWEIPDAAAFIKRLQALHPFECMAILDAVERYWSGPYHIDDSEEKLRRVGLV